MKGSISTKANSKRHLLLSLSADVHTVISSYLKTQEALDYSKTCKTIHDALRFQIIQNVNTIQYRKHNLIQSSNCSLCKEIIPSMTLIGKCAVHSYRIRCTFEEPCDSLTFFIKNCHEELMAVFIVDRDNTDIIIIPPNVDESYFLCHYQEDEDVELKFDVDILVQGILHRYEQEEEARGTKKLKRSLLPKSQRIC